jgi:outer membrane receptor for ferric coprogen and ferric-rhodotorulic acid
VLETLRNNNLITQAEVDRRSVSSNGATFDRISDGYEFQLTANPTASWRVLANFSVTNATEENIAPEVKAWAAEAFPFWTSFNQSVVSTNGQTLAQEQANLRDIMDELFETEGAGQFGNRRNKVNVFTRYSFTTGPLRGLFVGGGYRHQSKILIGRDPATLEKQYGNSHWEADLLAGFRVRGLPRTLTLDLQLNVANVFDDTDPLILRTQGANIRRLALVAPRTWRLTASLGF